MLPTQKRPWWLMPPGQIHPLWWIGVGAALIWVEYAAGPDTRFPLIYSIPVILAAWYSGIWPALALAVLVPVTRLTLLLDGNPAYPSSLTWLTLMRGGFTTLLALWFSRLADLERSFTQRVQVLEGLLPICAFCKSIRNERGQWERLETYISGRSTAEFSHAVCPTCGEKHYSGFVDDRRSTRATG